MFRLILQKIKTAFSKSLIIIILMSLSSGSFYMPVAAIAWLGANNDIAKQNTKTESYRLFTKVKLDSSKVNELESKYNIKLSEQEYRIEKINNTNSAIFKFNSDKLVNTDKKDNTLYYSSMKPGNVSENTSKYYSPQFPTSTFNLSSQYPLYFENSDKVYDKFFYYIYGKMNDTVAFSNDEIFNGKYFNNFAKIQDTDEIISINSIQKLINIIAQSVMVVTPIIYVLNAVTNFSIFYNEINQKIKQIATLRLLGKSKWSIYWFVTTERLLISLFAPLVGILIGLVLANIFILGVFGQFNVYKYVGVVIPMWSIALMTVIPVLITMLMSYIVLNKLLKNKLSNLVIGNKDKDEGSNKIPFVNLNKDKFTILKKTNQFGKLHKTILIFVSFIVSSMITCYSFTNIVNTFDEEHQMKNTIASTYYSSDDNDNNSFVSSTSIKINNKSYSFYLISSEQKNIKLKMSDEGIYLPRLLSSNYKVGSEYNLKVGTKEYKFKVAGYQESYFSPVIIMSDKYLKTIDSSIKNNTNFTNSVTDYKTDGYFENALTNIKSKAISSYFIFGISVLVLFFSTHIILWLKKQDSKGDFALLSMLGYTKKLSFNLTVNIYSFVVFAGVAVAIVLSALLTQIVNGSTTDLLSKNETYFNLFSIVITFIISMTIYYFQAFIQKITLTSKSINRQLLIRGE